MLVYQAVTLFAYSGHQVFKYIPDWHPSVLRCSHAAVYLHPETAYFFINNLVIEFFSNTEQSTGDITELKYQTYRQGP